MLGIAGMLAGLLLVAASCSGVDVDLPQEPSGVTVSVVPDPLTMVQCTEATLFATVRPPGTDPRVTWSVLDTAIGKVNALGVLTSGRPGTTKYRVTWARDTKIMAEGTLNVVYVGVASGHVAGIRSDTPGCPSRTLCGTSEVTFGIYADGFSAGPVQLLVDGAMVGTQPYPQGCPSRMSQVVFTIPTAGLANGEHVVQLRIADEGVLLERNVLAVQN